MKKGQIVMTAIIGLFVALMIGVAVIIPTIVGVINTAGIRTGSFEDSFNAEVGADTTLTNIPLIANSQDVDCGAIQLAETTDYTLNDTSGKMDILDDRTFTNYTFTSNLDKNSTVSKGAITIGYITTELIYNCSSNEVFDAGNYTVETDTGKIMVLGAGDMENNTLYCGNFTGAIINQDASCTADYNYIIAEGFEGAEGIVIDLLPLLFAVVLIVVVVGYIKLKE